jgi:hypothetical protein
MRIAVHLAVYTAALALGAAPTIAAPQGSTTPEIPGEQAPKKKPAKPKTPPKATPPADEDLFAPPPSKSAEPAPPSDEMEEVRVPPKPVTPLEVPEKESDVGRPCDKNFMNACAGGLVCVDAICQAPKRVTGTIEEPAEEAPVEDVRALRFGVQNAFFFGFAGKMKNPRPSYSIMADFGFPTGRRARWHVEVGYQDVNGYTGFRVNPFVLGYGVPVLRRPVYLEIEVVAGVIQSEILFNDGFAIALSSGLRAQLVVVYGVGWAAFSPLGFEIRYAYGVEDIGVETGVGANWPMLLTVGLEL